VALPGIPAPEARRTVLRAALILLVVVSPLPFGSVRHGAVLALEVSAVLLAALAWSVHRDEPAEATPAGRRMLLPACVLLAIGALQLVPLPAPVARWLGPEAAGARRAVAGLLPEISVPVAPCSFEPPATLDALLRLAAWVMIGAVSVVAVRTRAHLRQVMLGVAVSGAFQALYGSAEYLSGRQHIFGFPKVHFLDEATGTFINRNHFAAYLAMALPLALGLVFSGTRPSEGDPWRRRLVALSEGEGLVRIAGMLAAGSIWIGVVLSYSRGGMAAALAATGLVVLWRAIETRKTGALGVLGLLLVPTAWLILQDVRAPGERFFSQGTAVPTLALRARVWSAASGMIRDSPVLGTGYGTFEGAFEARRPAGVTQRWDHAHNDWLQSWTEAGPLAPLAALALLAAVFAGPAWRWGPPWTRFLRPTPVAAGVAAIAVHSTVDFGLRIPAVAVLAATLVGCAASPALAERRFPRAGKPAGALRGLAVAALLLVAGALSAGVYRARNGAALPGTPWMLGPPAAALDEAARGRLAAGLDVLNDARLAPAERVAGYERELAAAEDLLLRSLRARPAQPAALADLAAVRWDLDPPRTPEAGRRHLALIEVASRMAPAAPDVQKRLGMLLLKMGRRDEALGHLARAIELDASWTRDVVLMLYDHGLSPERILESLPADPAVPVHLEAAFLEESRAGEYRDLLERFLTSGADRLLLYRFGNACLRIGDPARLVERLGEMGELAAPAAEAERLTQLSLGLSAMGHYEAALAAARDAARRQPEAYDRAENLGDVALAAGDAEAAATGYRDALGILARGGGAAEYRARLYRKIGDAEARAGRPDRAYDAYRRALELDPDEARAREQVAHMEQAAGFD
jgi:O-antigen ligase/tetratricopeptide (TPR) repeat protein